MSTNDLNRLYADGDENRMILICPLDVVRMVLAYNWTS